MDPFVLSRNAFHIYCSKYLNNDNNQLRKNAIETFDQRYKYFLQTLDQLRISFEEKNKNSNMNSINNPEKDTLKLPSSTRKQKKDLYKLNKQRMPKILITVSCREHLTKQQPNIKIN